MIIVSQDYMNIVNFDNVISIESGEEFGDKILACGTDYILSLGDYSIMDKKDVIRKIYKAYCSEQKMFIMPEDK